MGLINTYRSKWARVFAFGVSAAVTVVAFQNCGQRYDIKEMSSAATPEPVIQNDQGDGDQPFQPDPGLQIQPLYESVTLSKKKAPPLKLVFVVDNSNSMTLSNLNLQRSISVMFDREAKTLSEFDSEIFFISTAQLNVPGLAENFLPRLRSPASVANLSLSDALQTYRLDNRNFGNLSGDVLGFRIETTSTAGSHSIQYLPQPVVQFIADSTPNLHVLNSISYKSGNSIEALKAQVAERLDLLSPNKASTIVEASLFPALDRESALCSVGRILRNPAGIIQSGDLASFVVVSDENESNPDGSLCLNETRKDNLYSINCSRTVPATYNYATRFNYKTLPGADFTRNVITYTPKDVLTKKRVSTINLSRAPADARCNGLYQREFTVNYTYLRPQYQINYTRWLKTGDQTAANATCTGTYQSQFKAQAQLREPQYKVSYTKRTFIGEREGGIKIYSNSPSNGSVVYVGAVPSDCNSTLSRLRTSLNDQTSELSQLSCTVDSDKVTAVSQTLSFASHTAAVAPSSSCPASVTTALLAGNAIGSIVNCSTTQISSTIPAVLITAQGMTTTSPVSVCDAAIAQVCSTSSGNLRSCAKTAFTESRVAGPIYSSTSSTASRLVLGTLPSDCSSNVATLRTQIGDSTSKLQIDSCGVAADLSTPASRTITFANHPSITLPSTSCPDDIKAAAMVGISGTLNACSMAERAAVAIPAAAINAQGMTKTGDINLCKEAIAKVCSTSSNSLRLCSYSSFVANDLGDSRPSVSAVSNENLTCDSRCDSVAGACPAANAASTIRAYATTINLGCTSSSTDSPTETYWKAQAQGSTTVDVTGVTPASSLTCSSPCSRAPAACLGVSSSATIESANKACITLSTPQSGTASVQAAPTTSVSDNSRSLTCQSMCSAAPSICTGLASGSLATTTIAQYITTHRLGKDCAPESIQSLATAARTETTTVPDLLISAANQNSCPAGYTIVENSMIKTGESNSQTQVAGGLSLAAYIKQRLNDFVGETFYTFNAFVTPPNSGSTASATSAGTAYQALVDDLGKGKTTDIRADSYEAALENLGSVLRNQLIRSIQFQKVTGTQKVHRVWKRSDSQSEWGEPLDKTLWTSSGGTVTLNSTLELGVDDELQIEFY